MKLFNAIQKRYGGRGYGRYLPMKWFYKNILPLGISSEIEYEGGQLYIGEKDTAGYSFLPYEVYEREVIKQQIKKGIMLLTLGLMLVSILYYFLNGLVKKEKFLPLNQKKRTFKSSVTM